MTAGTNWPLMMAHWLLVGAYVLAPLALITVSIQESRRNRGAWFADGSVWSGVALTLVAGLLLGAGLTTIYAIAMQGRFDAALAWQAAVASYFAVSLLTLLKAFDVGVRWASRKAVAWLANKDGRTPTIAANYLRAIVRVTVLLVIALPWVMASVMVYRPKVVMPGNPASELETRYDRVWFSTADGLHLAGWWLDAPSTTTVVVVHGLGSGKADVLALIGAMHDAECNVLAMDLRAHGESGGRLVSFGGREALDVAAAIEWVRRERPAQSERLFVVAASMGGAATLQAIEAGTKVDAVAILGSFDDLPALADAVVADTLPGALRWGAQVLALPMASLHAGYDLRQVIPARGAQAHWPAPILVVHGENDEVIPFARGQELFEAAFEPRRHFWVPRAGHVQILTNDTVFREIVRFFGEAGQVPSAPIVMNPLTP